MAVMCLTWNSFIKEIQTEREWALYLIMCCNLICKYMYIDREMYVYIICYTIFCTFCTYLSCQFYWLLLLVYIIVMYMVITM